MRHPPTFDPANLAKRWVSYFDIRPTFAHSFHDLQLGGNFFQRGIFGQPLEGVHYSLFVGHGPFLIFSGMESKTSARGFPARTAVFERP